jgi:cyclophilin family peptidyl-prolyl cis-trans isomerase
VTLPSRHDITTVRQVRLLYAPRVGWLLVAVSVFLSLTFLLAGCSADKTTSKDTDAADDEDVPDSIVKKGVKPEPDQQVAVIDTDYGKIVIELYPNIAPQMVERFKKLTGEGFYNGTLFHRINPQLGIIQGGDPLSRGNDLSRVGSGDSQEPNVPGEFSDIPYDRGIVGAARKGASPPEVTEAQARNTANCQFYITLKRVPDFDKRYTVFGKVIDGIGNADIIAGAPTQSGSELPAEKIVMKSVTLQPRSNFVKQ